MQISSSVEGMQLHLHLIKGVLNGQNSNHNDNHKTETVGCRAIAAFNNLLIALSFNENLRQII